MTVLEQLSADLSALAARAAPSVVGVERPRGQGSGLVLSPDGYVLTNAHVATAGAGTTGRAGPLRVRLPGGDAARGELVGADERTDLAVVRADARDLSPLPLAPEGRLAVGQIVAAIGNPLGFERTFTLGVVSALYRNLPTPGGGLLEGLVQTDAAVNPGNSGGPLLDASGTVVGVTTAMVPWAANIGFAVPARTASWVAAVLLQRGEVRRPFLGIGARAEELGAAVARSTGHARGVRVLQVEAGGPADRGGVAAGDLLLEADGSPLATLDDLQRALVLSPAPEIEVLLLRGGERRRLALRPLPAAPPRAA